MILKWMVMDNINRLFESFPLSNCLSKDIFFIYFFSVNSLLGCGAQQKYSSLALHLDSKILCDFHSYIAICEISILIVTTPINCNRAIALYIHYAN